MGDTSEVKIKVLFFAKSKELVGISKTYIQAHSGRIKGSELLDLILTEFPALQVLKENLILSVNQEYLERNQTTQLSDGMEIAVIPPISGG